jgi:LPXTG-motif cell wall-anchored protein/uncharacterized repeat protein (TIGR01451 family)
MMRKKRFSAITVAIMFMLQIFLGSLPLESVKAAEVISFPFITSVSIKDASGNDLGNNISKSSEIHVNYTWSIPNDKNVSKDDFYIMQLPSQINIAAPIDMPIKDSFNETIADMHIGTNGSVKITFSEYASEHSNVTGSFFVDCHFKASEIGNTNPVPINFVIPGVAVPVKIDVEFQQPDPTAVKDGTYDSLTDEITWTVTVNKEGVRLNNASVEDIINVGQDFVPNSVKIDGNSAAYTYDEVSKKLVCSLGNITTQKVVTFKTSIRDNLATKSQGNYNYNNTAFLKYEDNSQSKSITSNTKSIPVSVKYISKDGSYDSVNKRINWSIKVNESGRTIDNAVVTDVIPSGLTLDDSTVKLDGVLKTKNEDYTISGQNFSYNLGNITGQKTITFSTLVDPTVYNSNTSKNYNNTAILSGVGVLNGTSSSKNVGFTPNIISKQGSSYDAATGIITWRITVNTDKTNIAAGAVITDNIPIGQTYVANSASLDGTSLDDSVYTEALSGDATKTGTFAYTFADAFSNTHTIIFKTQVVDAKRYRANYNGTYSNSVNITAIGVNQNTSGSQAVSSEVIKKTGTNYNYVTREITWQIIVNNNKMPITNAVITDNIPIGQEYVENSAAINNGASLGGFSYASTEGDSTKTGTLTYTFPQGSSNAINNTYTITFKTKLTDLSIFNANGDKTVSNTASITGSEIPTDGNRSSTGTRTIKNSVISKTPTYTYGTDYIDWIVETNSNFSIPLSGATITDTLQDGLSLDTDTVELYKMTVNADGTRTQGEKIALGSENVKYSPDTRKFIFAFPEGSGTWAFMLKFRTNVNRTGTYTNSVEFKGSAVEQTSSSNPVGVWYSTGGGGGTGESGSITVVKVDSKDSTKRLAGAVFQILDRYGNVKTTSAPTDANGSVIFNKLKYDINYSVREVTAPTGYNLGDEVYTFQIHNAVDQKNITYNYMNEIIKGNIEFTKTGEAGEGLQGAEFSLYKDSDSDFQSPLAAVVSDSDGKVKFENIEYGSYRIKETKAPEGYMLSSEILQASISEDGKTVNPDKAVISNTIIRGGIKITKTDAATSDPVPGATITIYTKAGEQVGSGVQGLTGSDGTVEFNNLAYGDYYFLETNAPEGYVLNEDKHPFSIKDNGVIIQDSLNNTKIAGGINITKIDATTSVPVPGATIAIYTKGGDKVGSGIEGITGTDGTVEFNNLTYGDYYFIETEAPEGYLLNSDKHEFTIKDDGVILKDTLSNEKIKGTVEIRKNGEDGDYLEDTEFTLFDINGQAVQKAVTDENGLAKFINVEYGSYNIKETKAPKGYTISDTIIPIQVNGTENGKIYDAGTVTDAKIRASIQINKVDKDGNPIQGAEFTLYDSEGKVLKTTMSALDGIAIFEDLVYGDYSLEETKAPEGYKLNNKVLKVYINSLETQVFTIQNEKITLGLPKTGEFMDTKVLIAIGVFVILVGTIFMFRNKKERKQN